MFIGLINLLMLFIVDIDISIDTYKEKEKKKVDTSYKEEILLLLFMTVCIRGFVGTVTKFNWNSNILMGFLLVMCITFGKMFGGIIGDKIGFKKLSLISLGGASILFLFGNKFIICGLLAQFLFNMTMPITLTLMVNMFQNQKGKMFGLTTLALFIGFMVSLIFNTSLSEFMFIQFISCIVSLIFMIVGVQLYNQNFDKSSNKKKMEGVKND
jgi:MFS family permease